MLFYFHCWMSSAKIKLLGMFDSIFNFALPLQKIQTWEMHIYFFNTWSQTTWRLQTSYHYLKLTWPKGSYGVLPSLGIRHYKVYGGFLLIRCTQKKEEAQKMSKGCVHIMGINYLLFIWFWWGFFSVHALRKSLSETFITLLCNLYWGNFSSNFTSL
jgi:hypothetical protein